MCLNVYDVRVLDCSIALQNRKNQNIQETLFSKTLRIHACEVGREPVMRVIRPRRFELEVT